MQIKFSWQANLQTQLILSRRLLLKHTNAIYLLIYLLCRSFVTYQENISVQFPFGHLTPRGSAAAICSTEARFNDLNST